MRLMLMVVYAINMSSHKLKGTMTNDNTNNSQLTPTPLIRDQGVQT